jgi:hypothetical protein
LQHFSRFSVREAPQRFVITRGPRGL